jgi:methylmalonyl-CoA/ethylmalonyl-CoA epimerase
VSALDTPGAIVQHAYTVADIETAALAETRTLGIGPWFLRGPFTPPHARYRGAPNTATFTLARAFRGPVMVELIQQHDEEPSVFRERPLGFHHWATMPADFEAELARLHGKGFQTAFEDVLPTGARIAYVDTSTDLPGMLELVERTPDQLASYGRIHAASLDWDGSEPLREG